MKFYCSPALEFLEFAVEDIVMTSSDVTIEDEFGSDNDELW